MDVILASTVIAAIISTLFSFIQNKKSENLKYITAERTKWREEIRSVSEKMSVSNNQSELELSLIKLKLRINPDGKYHDDYFKDAHIWYLIGKLEEHDANNFINERNALLDYMSLLLKRDWEISKQEIKGDVYRIFKILSYIADIAAYIWTVFLFWSKEFSMTSLVPLVLILLSYFAIPNLSTKAVEIHIKVNIGFKIKSLIRVVVYYIIIVLCMSNIGSDIDSEYKVFGILLISVLGALTFLFDYAITNNNYIDERNYIQKVLSVKEKYLV